MSSDNNQEKKFNAKRFALRSWFVVSQFFRKVKSAGLKKWIAPGVAFTISIILLWNLGGKIREEVWAYYTDGEDIKISSEENKACLLYTSPSPRDLSTSRMPSSA